MSLPSVLADGVKELYDEANKPAGLFQSGDEAAALVVGLAASAVVGYLSIAWLLHFLTRYSTALFVGYRLVLGAVILGLIAARLVPG